MSYYDEIPLETRKQLKEVTIPFQEYFEKFKQDFHFYNSNGDISKFELKIENAVFTKENEISGVVECKLKFDNCYFLDEISIYNATFNNTVELNSCFFDKRVEINRTVEFKDVFNIINASTENSIIINGGKYQECYWSLIDDNGSLIINKGEFEHLVVGYWGGARFKEVSFDLRKIKGPIKVCGEGTQIQKLQLAFGAENSSISIEDIYANSISIYRYRNEKGLKMLNVKALKGNMPTEFSIAESYLGKAEFYSLDFSSFEKVNLIDVHLVECIFVNIKWKHEIDSFKGRFMYHTIKDELLQKNVEILKNNSADHFEIDRIKNDPEVINYFFKNREVYRQLKFALGKQGDIINEQNFHAKEIVAYNRTLQLDKAPWTKLIIKMSFCFSDFGQSFIRPFWGLIIGHLILVFILILSNHYPNLSINFIAPNWKSVELGIHEYFILINPLRKPDPPFEGWRIIIDILMRIWSSYMIYNIIRATRRFIK